ncbi:MAG: hypothetical protein M3Q85_10545 [Acidobacteriota bacterium]|nr:hypothetical protein [Acidobacteriota bacterium]
MKRTFRVMGIVVALIISGLSLAAHDKYRIIGTVAKVTEKLVDVTQTKDGKTITMDMTDKTVVTRDKKKVGRADLKTGLSVVVDALGDSLDELDVVEIRIVPPSTKK